MNKLKFAFEFQRKLSVVIINIKIRTWKLGTWNTHVCVCGRSGTGFLCSRHFAPGRTRPLHINKVFYKWLKEKKGRQEGRK